MNTTEIDTFTGRLAAFTDRGLAMADSEALADRLVVRDREQDDRRVCLECPRLRGTGSWRCGNGLEAGMAIRAGDVPLPADLVLRLVCVRPSHLDLTRPNKDACVHKFSMDTCTQLRSLQTRARRTNAAGAAIPTISKRV